MKQWLRKKWKDWFSIDRPKHLILLMLSDGTSKHGYALQRECQQRYNYLLAPSTFYRAAHQLKQEGLVVEDGRRPDITLDDEIRVYYKITFSGTQFLERYTKQ